MRPTKEQYYLNIAYEVAKRSTCMRRKYGAVIVKNDEIISTGYNGAPRGVTNCIDYGRCLREELNIKPGEHYEICKAIHAEQNAIISASRNDLIGSTLYLAGIDSKTNEHISAEPCIMCKRFILNAGIDSVVSEHLPLKVSVEDLVPDDDIYLLGDEYRRIPVSNYIKELDVYGKNN